jgi:glycosyltransferase involved in cell wall biosynthesis
VNDGGTAASSSPACQRIGINAHLLAEGESYRRAGVSRYIYNLIAHLSEADPGGDYTVFLNSRCAFRTSYRQKRSRLPTETPSVRILWEQFFQPPQLVAARIALLHSPVNIQPLFLPCRGVITVMDLTFVVYPESFKPAQRLYQKVFTRLSARRASHLIAISGSTARDLTRFFAVPNSKITVIFPGVDAAYRPIRDESLLASFRLRHSLPKKFILSVGTLEPRKNLVTLLHAYAQFKRQANTNHKLVLAGGKGWFYQPIFAAVEELGLQGDVLFPGFVAEDELPLWYNTADVFVYPSLYEGFGLPPLEAMACGKPVAVADSSSLPEVVGDAALCIDPYQPEEWAAALLRLCQDASLRSDLAARALERAGQFSWTRMARETAQVYRDVLGYDRGGA